jgi:hypothetical protein
MVDRCWLTVAGEPLKQRSLRSFHISHATKANKVSAPFRFSPCHLGLQLSHHASQLSAPIGTKSGQDGPPNLPRERTGGDDVVDGFGLLVT